MAQKFKSNLTNLGGFVTQNVKVTAPEGSVIKVPPKRLVFESKHEKQ